MLRLYSIFHLNLAYSSISEQRRAEVIEKCYWPLLRLAIEENIPLAIEASAYTLETVKAIDPDWVAFLREGIKRNHIEFIGSGYSQLIAPLVPEKVNVWNMTIGNEVYKKILNFSPKLWYINEQAYSSGILKPYRAIKATAIIMEWNNPKTLHQKWLPGYQYFSQVVEGNSGEEIPIIWNDSISFQKFQRFIHGDITKKEYSTYLKAHNNRNLVRNFCLYGSDAEIFDFRPGRFHTEKKLGLQNEWEKIKNLFITLRAQNDTQLIFPSEVLTKPVPFQPLPVKLKLESPECPIPVKKQQKYNITRWAVTGRNNVFINTSCYKIYYTLIECIENIISESRRESSAEYSQEIGRLKKELCFLWSSDFRTHITLERWEIFLTELQTIILETNVLHKKIVGREKIKKESLISIKVNKLSGIYKRTPNSSTFHNSLSYSKVSKPIFGAKKFFKIETPFVSVIFNRYRGSAFHHVVFPTISHKPLVGSVSHGYFEDIAFSADWYTANFVLQQPGNSQITDLENVFSENIVYTPQWIEYSCRVKTELGEVFKCFRIFKKRPHIDIIIHFDWEIIPYGSFKGAFITLLPEAYNRKKLFYATKNGGGAWEIFYVAGREIKHDAPSSSLVTASTGLGATEGLVILGDDKYGIGVSFDQTICAAMPMIHYQEVPPNFFCQLLLSCGEVDETRRQEVKGPLTLSWSIFGMENKKL